MNTDNNTFASGNAADTKTTRMASPDADNSRKGAVIAGVAGAAVLAGGGTAAAMALADDNDATDADGAEEEIVIGEDFNPDESVGGLGDIFVSSDDTDDTQNHHDVNGPVTQPIAQTEPDNPGHDNVIGEDDVVIPDDTTPEDIIAVTEVDPEDNDMPELLSFNNVELVPTEDGEVMISADFTLEGDSYTMVDVDNDGIFDAVVDASGEMQGSAGGMMLSDIELIANEGNNDYLAANEHDNNSDVSATGDASADDIVTV